jgi:F0F1-type ATP synthase assembly protein I
LRGAKESNAVLRTLSRPIRIVLAWQLAVSAAMALAAWLLAGPGTALSAAAGGAVSMLAGLASALVVSLGKAKGAGGVLVGALRAEVVKISLALLLLWLVLANCAEVVVGVFVGAFVVTMLVFSMAFFVREY